MKRNIARTVTVPPVLKQALVKAPQAEAIFNQLPPSHRREYMEWISSAKKEETLKSRLDKMTSMLLAKAQPKG